MGHSIDQSTSAWAEMSAAHFRALKAFLLSNYLLLGAASGSAFLTLSLRLIPTLSGLSLILLHALTIGVAISACAAASGNSGSPSGKWYAAHMMATVMVAIFQGAVAVLIFSRTSNFLLEGIKSYVREEDGVVILRMVAGLSVAIFCLEWVVIGLAFVLRYYAYVDGERLGGGTVRRSVKGEEMKDWPWPFQV